MLFPLLDSNTVPGHRLYIVFNFYKEKLVNRHITLNKAYFLITLVEIIARIRTIVLTEKLNHILWVIKHS